MSTQNRIELKKLVGKIYEIISTVTAPIGKITKKEFYKGIFMSKRKNGYIMPDDQISKWILGNIKMSDDVLTEIVLSSENAWIKSLIGYKFDKVMEYSVKTQLLNLKEDSLDRVDSSEITIEQLIALLIVHAVKNSFALEKYEGIVCVGREQEIASLNNLTDGTNRSQFAIITGPAKIGKTEFIKYYLQIKGFGGVYIDYSSEKYNSFEKTLKSIALDEEAFIEDIIKKELGYSDVEKLRRLQNIEDGCKKAIVVDNFIGSTSEIYKFYELSCNGDILFVIVTQEEFPDMPNQVRLDYLKPEQIGQIFYAFNEKGEESSIVAEISQKLLGQAWLMRFIAKWYEDLYKSNAQEAFKALEELNHELDSNIFEKLKMDKEIRITASSKQLKLIGHIRGVAKKYLKEEAKSTYLLLACLGGIEMPKEYLLKWLNVNENILDYLTKIGWCIETEKKDKICIHLPKIVAMANCKNIDRKSVIERQIICDFMDKFSREIRCEENGTIDSENIDIVISNIHDFCIQSNKYNSSAKFMKQLQKFHLDCVRYYLLMCDADKAEALYDREKQRLEINEDSITILALKVREQLLKGDILALIEIEDKYLKPFLHNKIEYDDSEIMELREIVKIIQDVSWSNLERIFLENNQGIEKFVIICANPMKTYSSLYENLSHEIKGFVQEIGSGRYVAQIRLQQFICEKYNSNVNSEPWSANDELGYLIKLYNEYQEKTELSRMETLEKMRFLLDFAFLLGQIICILTPDSDMRVNLIKLFEIVKYEIGKCFEMNSNMFPKDIKAKFVVVSDCLCKIGLMC